MGAPQKLGIADPTEHCCTTMTSNAAEIVGTLWICQLLIADRSPRHQKLMSMISGVNATFEAIGQRSKETLRNGERRLDASWDDVKKEIKEIRQCGVKRVGILRECWVCSGEPKSDGSSPSCQLAIDYFWREK